MFVIEIQKDGEGFGFSIHGGSDVGFALRVMKIAPGKAADRDGRLLVSIRTWFQFQKCTLVHLFSN